MANPVELIVVTNPQGAQSNKTQKVGNKMRRLRVERTHYLPSRHRLGNLKIQHQNSHDNRENSIAQSFDARGGEAGVLVKSGVGVVSCGWFHKM